MPNKIEFLHTDTERFSCVNELRRGPVVVALDNENRLLGVVQVEVLTTLGALKAFSKTKRMYGSAAVILPAIAIVRESEENEGYRFRVCAQNSHSEKQWWDELLLWAARNDGLCEIEED